MKITHAKICFSSNLTGNIPSLQRDLGSDGNDENMLLDLYIFCLTRRENLDASHKPFENKVENKGLITRNLILSPLS